MTQPVFNDNSQTLIAGPAHEDVEMVVRMAIADTLERPVDEVLPESDLEKDLGLDSLGIIHASLGIEEQLHVPVLDLEAAEFTFKTVGDLTEFVANRAGTTPLEKEGQQPC
jgi:acyl carrier protein